MWNIRAALALFVTLQTSQQKEQMIDATLNCRKYGEIYSFKETRKAVVCHQCGSSLHEKKCPLDAYNAEDKHNRSQDTAVMQGKVSKTVHDYHTKEISLFISSIDCPHEGNARIRFLQGLCK